MFSLPLLAEENEIALRIKPGHESGSRTLEDIVTASIDEQVLTASFTDVTASSIVVYDETDPYTVLLNQSYAPAYSAQVNLTSLPEGDYIVDIFAFDEWWTGSFSIE